VYTRQRQTKHPAVKVKYKTISENDNKLSYILLLLLDVLFVFVLCTPYFASFSGLSFFLFLLRYSLMFIMQKMIINCLIFYFYSWMFCLSLSCVHLILPVSLDCPFLISSSIFSNVYYAENDNTIN
jgi:hypothetical protein